MTVEFRLLGDVAVLVDGRPLQLGGTRQRSVLTLLLLQRNRPVATASVADRLWPDEQPLTAIKTVQVYVSRLRHIFGSEADRITSHSTGYRLTAADDELDAARFEGGLRLAREAVASGSTDASVVMLETALAAWSGPALGDLGDEPFARHEALRLDELRLQAIEELYELRIDVGLGRDAITELRRHVGEHPGRERLWGLLMLALYGDGRQGEALQAYQDARRYLANELGLDPGPDLQALEGAILTQDAARPRQVTVPTGPRLRRDRRVVTVLRAERVHPPNEDTLDPEVLESIGRRTLEVVRRAVERHGGTIDLADPNGVTAVFGLLVAREDDALRAVRAASELVVSPGSTGDPDPLLFGVSLATGEVLAVAHGSDRSAVSGAPVHIASRLAAHAAPGDVVMVQETERLVRSMVSTEPLSDATTGTKQSPGVRLLGLIEGETVARPPIAPFVGRERELDLLVAAFERVAAGGAPGWATVIGAPGVGKSRLVAESFAQMSGRARILRSRCLPYGDGITYWPVRELVVAATGIAPGETRSKALAKLDAIVARLDRGDLVRSRVASIIGLADDPVPGEEIAWAVRRFIEAVARDGPLILLVDDLQWAEPALLETLDHVQDAGQGPILLVTVARPELEEVRPDVLARPSLVLIRLDALDPRDAATLLDHLAPELPPGPLRSRIVATTEGNPLFLEQFVAFASEEAGGVARMLDERTDEDLPIPPTIGTLLAARLDRLPEIERGVLERAAVVGRSFWASAVADLMPVDERAGLPRHLAQLARCDLIRAERSDKFDDEGFRFRHLLIRDAAYGALPKRKRADLHERFAGWLERHWAAVNPGEYDLIVGYHLEQAYRYRVELGDALEDARVLAERALLYIAPAGRTALERGDPHAAASLLRRAIRLDPDDRQRIELLLDLRIALRAIGEAEASDGADEEAVDLLAQHPHEGLEHRRAMTEILFDGGGPIVEIEHALRYYERNGDRLGMIRALEAGNYVYTNRGEFDTSMAYLDRATGIALELGRADHAAGFSARAARALPDSPMPIPEALDRCQRFLDLAGDNREARATILLTIGELEARGGVRDVWRRHFDAAKTIIDDLGLVQPLDAALYPLVLGLTELVAGEPARTVDLLCASCSRLERLGDIGHLSSLAPLTAQTLLALNRLGDVERYAFWGRDIADSRDLDAHARWRIALSGLRTEQGRHPEAVELAAEAVTILAASGFAGVLEQAHVTLAGALRASGDEPAALTAAKEARRLAVAKQDQAALRTISAFLRD